MSGQDNLRPLHLFRAMCIFVVGLLAGTLLPIVIPPPISFEHYFLYSVLCLMVLILVWLELKNKSYKLNFIVMGIFLIFFLYGLKFLMDKQKSDISIEKNVQKYNVNKNLKITMETPMSATVYDSVLFLRNDSDEDVLITSIKLLISQFHFGRLHFAGGMFDLVEIDKNLNGDDNCFVIEKNGKSKPIYCFNHGQIFGLGNNVVKEFKKIGNGCADLNIEIKYRIISNLFEPLEKSERLVTIPFGNGLLWENSSSLPCGGE